METKKLIIICISIIAIIAIVCGAIIYLDSFKDTNLSLKESNVYKNKNITFTLTDVDGNPLANKNITINITSSKNKTKSYNLTTNDKGIAKLNIKLSKGKYTVNAVFGGEGFYKSSNITKKLKVKVKVKRKSSNSNYNSESSSTLVMSVYGYYAETDYSKRYDMDNYIYDANGNKMYWVQYDGYDGSYRHLGD